jgi:hypothetical protein
LRAALGQAAITAARGKNTYVGARYRRLVGHTGRKRAVVALAHKILIAVWYILGEQVTYHDLGVDFYDRRIDTEHTTRRAVDQLRRLGYAVTLERTQTA